MRQYIILKHFKDSFYSYEGVIIWEELHDGLRPKSIVFLPDVTPVKKSDMQWT